MTCYTTILKINVLHNITFWLCYIICYIWLYIFIKNFNVNMNISSFDGYIISHVKWLEGYIPWHVERFCCHVNASGYFRLGGILRTGCILRYATCLIISKGRVRNAEECSWPEAEHWCWTWMAVHSLSSESSSSSKTLSSNDTIHLVAPVIACAVNTLFRKLFQFVQ